MLTIEKCPDSMLEYIRICTEIGDFDQTLDDFGRILSGVRLLSKALVCCVCEYLLTLELLHGSLFKQRGIHNTATNK